MLNIDGMHLVTLEINTYQIGTNLQIIFAFAKLIYSQPKDSSYDNDNNRLIKYQ